ncbi:hypothetical protein [Neptuniibacter sp.]|uniref:hypothetical protein n=1 Tax=Neptuniibacter sp. TaxID=1962643 RepID=UPI00260965F3|nr:hypothetical protein [Neptuniibacter sp.]MCP4598442.1 hypothetical protein [Neptuniibacter sp.]
MRKGLSTLFVSLMLLQSSTVAFSASEPPISIILIFEKTGLNTMVDHAAENAAIAFASDYKKGFDKRFDLDLPQEYVEYAANCYYSDLSWNNYKVFLDDVYSKNLSKEDFLQLKRHYLEEGKGLDEFPSGIDKDNANRLRADVIQHMLDSKRKCFRELKEVVRPYFIRAKNIQLN